MSESSFDTIQMQFKLLQESLWNLEDKFSVVLDSDADHEAELIRLKRRLDHCVERISKLETQHNSPFQPNQNDN